MPYSTWHWRIYNIHRRLLGLMACVAGITFTGWGVILLAHPEEAVPVNGQPVPGAALKLVVLSVGLLALTVGVWLLRRRPYRPDLGDVSWLLGRSAVRDEGQQAGPRSWWTGDVRRTRRAAGPPRT